MSYLVGASKMEMTAFAEGTAMLGYGRPQHQIKGIETPIHARAVVIESQGRKVVLVNCEIGFPTIYLKYGVIWKLKELNPGHGFKDEDIMLSAQHTHSAGGGICQHWFYNVPTPGFKKETWETYRTAIAKAILEADKKKRPASIKYGTGDFNEKEEVAFNRSLEPYNANPEIKKKLKKDEWHLAVDRTMKLLRFEDEEGKVIAEWNFFGTHCTSISNDKYKICYDNKGYAAEYAEKHLREKQADPDAVCVFAQEATGDVTPNYIWDRRRQWTRGKFKDDYESAKYVGDLQYAKASSISDGLDKSDLVSGNVRAIQSYVDFDQIICDRDLVPKDAYGRTSQACLGIRFLEGTKEGPGLPKAIGNVARMMLDIHRQNEMQIALKRGGKFADYVFHKYRSQYPKHIGVEAGKGKIIWNEDLTKFPIPGFIEKSLDYIRDAAKQKMARFKPWILTRLPLQIIIIGEIAIVAMPTEITTVAGRRLRKFMKDCLEEQGVKEVILAPYSNGYAGYVTTPEEYQLQHYEGGHTLFGKWTLPAMMTEFRKLADALESREGESIGSPLIFTEDMLWVVEK